MECETPGTSVYSRLHIFKTPSKQRMIFVIGGGLEKKLSIYDRREILWAQKVRSDWVIFDDRNT